MGLFDFLKKKPPENKSAQNKSIILSQYSNMPRYFTIGSKTYDIDNPDDIKRLPVFSNVMTVNGVPHGMDAILLKHGAQAKQHNENIYEAAIRKVKQYWEHGVRSVPETDGKALLTTTTLTSTTASVPKTDNEALLTDKSECASILSKQSSVQISNDIQRMSPDPILPEEYDRKREIERQYLESKYDFNSIEGIHAIPVSIHEDHPEFICGVTGYVEYFLQTKGGQHEKAGRAELAIACYRKANEIMPLRGVGYYKKDRYMRLPRYLRKLRRFDEARIEEEKIKNYFDHLDVKAHALNHTLQQAEERGQDLLVARNSVWCCAECAKYRNRVYSISGKDVRFPKLPPYLLDTKLNCCLFLYSFYCDISSIRDSAGNAVDPVQYSNRPFVDDRSEDEKNDYLKILQQREDEHICELVSADYDWIWEFLPELCPKSRSAYSRMRNMNSEKYQQIVRAAAERGKILTPLKTTPPG